MSGIKREVVIGDCRLLLGDCREILPELGRFDAVVTDPPYGIYGKGGKWGKKKDHIWDRSAATIDHLLAVAPTVCIWGGNYFPLPPSRGWLVWYKRDSVPSAADVELAWTNRDMNSRLIDHTISATNPERGHHPTQKPIAVMLWCLCFFPDSQHVLDPYCGSGTTGVACVRLDRKFTGIEIDEKYFEIACRRIEAAYAQPKLFSQPEPQPEQVDMFSEK